jgi:phage repressor protein C with HTH and peptisase S24 domain
MGIGKQIKDARETRGWSQHELARVSKVPQSAIHRIEWEDTSTSKHVPVLLRALDLSPDRVTHEIPLVGYVGAGAEIFPMDSLGYVEAPPGIAGPRTVAVQVRGDSMLPVYRDGDVIYYDRHQDPADLIGRDVVVELMDGRCLVKQLFAGTSPGTWTLLSHNAAPIVDAHIEWAARVRWVQKA